MAGRGLKRRTQGENERPKKAVLERTLWVFRDRSAEPGTPFANSEASFADVRPTAMVAITRPAMRGG